MLEHNELQLLISCLDAARLTGNASELSELLRMMAEVRAKLVAMQEEELALQRKEGA